MLFSQRYPLQVFTTLPPHSGQRPIIFFCVSIRFNFSVIEFFITLLLYFFTTFLLCSFVTL
ncbi:hypothetical protein EVA_13826 [gut metagenome]|uniref:Uncharacterized protein n=1 Tax=gut metagenome TaxID=749906 RepID=J9G8I7_9ZZZZ